VLIYPLRTHEQLLRGSAKSCEVLLIGMWLSAPRTSLPVTDNPVL
jgi:hypothetical protein